MLDDIRRRIVVVTLNLLGIDMDLADEMRARIEKETGIPSRNIMLNCSHTHSAPLTVPWKMSKKEIFSGCLHQWRKELLNKISETVKLAISNLQEAKFCFGRQRVRIGFNRRLLTKRGIVMRPNRKGAIVPWVDVLGVYNKKREPMAILS